MTCAGGDAATFADPATGLLAHDGAGCTRTLVWTGPEKIGALVSALALALLLLLGRLPVRGLRTGADSAKEAPQDVRPA